MTLTAKPQHRKPTSQHKKPTTRIRSAEVDCEFGTVTLRGNFTRPDTLVVHLDLGDPSGPIELPPVDSSMDDTLVVSLPSGCEPAGTFRLTVGRRKHPRRHTQRYRAMGRKHPRELEPEPESKQFFSVLDLTLGAVGPEGPRGLTGPAGPAGASCWDLDADLDCDIASEDVNHDGACTVADCRGAPGEPGPEGPPGNLVLANMMCPAGSFVSGFDANGNLVCTQSVPPPSSCGNSVLDPGEACDDGNLTDGDGCSSSCRVEDQDGDGILDPDDNCPATPNPDQIDTDVDGIGNACEGAPIDVILAVDGSDSMEQIEFQVADGLGLLLAPLRASGKDAHVIVIGDRDSLLCGPCLDDPNLLYVDRSVGSGDALARVIDQYPNYQAFLRPNTPKHIVVVTDDDDSQSPASFNASLETLADPGFPDGYYFHSLVDHGQDFAGTTIPLCGADVGETYLALSTSTGGYAEALADPGSVGLCALQSANATFAALAQAFLDLDDGTECDVNGVFESIPPVAYSCAFGVFNINPGTWTFLENGTLSVLGNTLPALTGAAGTCSNRSFDVSALVPGGCEEAYRLTGSLANNNTWNATLSIEFVPTSAGACFDCTSQVFELTGRRQP